MWHCATRKGDRYIVSTGHSPHCISLGSTLQCCSEMWELLQTETNGDSCPGREKICIESRQSFGSDIKNIPRRERAVHCSLHAAPAGCSLDSAVIHTAGIIVLCRLSQPSQGNVSTRLPRCGWTLLNLLISFDFQRISDENPRILKPKYCKIFQRSLNDLVNSSIALFWESYIDMTDKRS